MIRGERVIAILAAGGSGQRAGLAKQWLALGGETVLRRSARLLAACDAVDAVIAVVPPGEEARVAAAAARDGAALAAVPITDTVKRGAANADPPRVAATLDRRTLWLAQTPQ